MAGQTYRNHEEVEKSEVLIAGSVHLSPLNTFICLACFHFQVLLPCFFLFQK